MNGHYLFISKQLTLRKSFIIVACCDNANVHLFCKRRYSFLAFFERFDLFRFCFLPSKNIEGDLLQFLSDISVHGANQTPFNLFTTLSSETSICPVHYCLNTVFCFISLSDKYKKRYKNNKKNNSFSIFTDTVIKLLHII